MGKEKVSRKNGRTNVSERLGGRRYLPTGKPKAQTEVSTATSDSAARAKAKKHLPEAVSENVLFGRNPVLEALKSGRDIERLVLQRGLEGSAKVIEAKAKDKNLRIQYAEKSELDRLANGGAHQGVIAFVPPYRYYELDDLLADAEAVKDERDPLIVLLDGLEDPHNLGAILRTCDCVGATGVVIPKNRSVSLSEGAAKASAGAAEYVKVAKVTNLARALDELKEKGFWTAACDMDGKPFTSVNLTGPMAVVIGGEGQGVSRLMREKCDFIVSIPMRGHVNSLNASNAAAILLYEIDRQRRLSGGAEG